MFEMIELSYRESGKESHMLIPDGYLDAVEVARRISKTVMTVRRYCANGTFPGAYKNGRARTSPWFIPEKAVDEYLDSLKAAAPK